MSWTINGTTVPAGDEPLEDSDWPEIQEDRHAEQEVLGSTAADSSVVTFLGTPSRRATLHFWCSTTTRDQLIGLKRLTFAIIDPWSISTNWYLKTLRIRRIKAGMWSPQTGSGQRFHCWAELVGR